MTGTEQPGSWPEDRKSRLRELWSDKKFSAQAIANELNARESNLALTRSAVIGKAHRMGLEPKAPRGGRTRLYGKKARKKRSKEPRTFSFATQSAKPQKPVPPTILKMTDIVPLNGTGIIFGDATSEHCHAVIKETSMATADAIYCGLPVKDGFAYCASHYAAFHQPPRPRYQPATPLPAVRE